MKRISHWGLVLGSLGLLLGLPVSMAGAPGSALFEQMKAQYHKDYGLELVADEEVYPVAESNGAITARNADMIPAHSPSCNSEKCLIASRDQVAPKRLYTPVRSY